MPFKPIRRRGQIRADLESQVSDLEDHQMLKDLWIREMLRTPARSRRQTLYKAACILGIFATPVTIGAVGVTAEHNITDTVTKVAGPNSGAVQGVINEVRTGVRTASNDIGAQIDNKIEAANNRINSRFNKAIEQFFPGALSNPPQLNPRDVAFTYIAAVLSSTDVVEGWVSAKDSIAGSPNWKATITVSSELGRKPSKSRTQLTRIMTLDAISKLKEGSSKSQSVFVFLDDRIDQILPDSSGRIQTSRSANWYVVNGAKPEDIPKLVDQFLISRRVSSSSTTFRQTSVSTSSQPQRFGFVPFGSTVP